MTRRRSSRSGVVSHDEHGVQHLLVVSDHAGAYVSIGDTEMIRLLTPHATVALVLELIRALGDHVPAQPGPLSGSM